MKFLTTALVVFGACAHAAPTDTQLMAALHDLRNRIEFKDLSPEGRLAERGAVVASFGFGGFTMMQLGDEVALRPVAATVLGVVAVASVAAMVAGSATYLSARLVQLIAPRPRLAITDPAEFTSAAGLNQFMRYTYAEQLALARRSPELAEYIVQLGDAATLATKFGLIQPRQ